MKNKFPLPYIDHLAFQQAERYKCDSCSKFEGQFNELKNLEISSIKKQSIAVRCVEEFEGVMEEISLQALTEREKLVFKDLKQHGLRLLREDLKVLMKRLPLKNLHDGAMYRKSEFRNRKLISGHISPKSVENIVKLTSSELEKIKQNANNGKTRREDLSINSGDIIDQVNIILNNEFTKNEILSLFSDYMGTSMVVVGSRFELSVPEATWWKGDDHSSYPDQPKTHYLHFDESIAYPKAIVYLNDVTHENGPTSYTPNFIGNVEMSNIQHLIGRAITCVVGSSQYSEIKNYYNHVYHHVLGCPIFKRDFSKLPDSLRFCSHFGWDIIPNSPLETFLIDDEKTITGPAGTFVAFDGSNLPHRGGQVLKGERISLQVMFGEQQNSGNSNFATFRNYLKRFF